MVLIFVVFDRLQVECDKNHKQVVEIQSLQRLLAQKELMIEEGRIAIQAPLNDLDHLEREHQKILRDLEDVKKRW